MLKIIFSSNKYSASKKNELSSINNMCKIAENGNLSLFKQYKIQDIKITLIHKK